jgi:outer membrane protein assembly factor BamB
VYTGAAGDGGYVYAYAESNGALEWQESVENGMDSSPAVTSHDVYVSYPCQTYDFDPQTGKQIWHSDRSCDGGGGSTPVLYDGLLFVGDSGASSDNGLILKADSGKVAGSYSAHFIPAFARHRGFFVTDHGLMLRALDVPSMHRAWTARRRRDRYATPPLVVGDTVYIETEAGKLLGYAIRDGERQVALSLGYTPRYMSLSAALGFGSDELIVPDGNKLIALKGS